MDAGKINIRMKIIPGDALSANTQFVIQCCEGNAQTIIPGTISFIDPAFEKFIPVIPDNSR